MNITIEKEIKNKEKSIKKFNKEVKDFILSLDLTNLQKQLNEDIDTILQDEKLQITSADIECSNYNLKPLGYDYIVKTLESLNYYKFYSEIHVLKLLISYKDNIYIDENYLDKINNFINNFNELEKTLHTIYKYKNIYNIYINNLILINKFIYSLQLYIEKLNEK